MGDDWVYSDGGRQEFNSSILQEYGYVIYPNNTVSNYSNCFLAFGPYVATIISNGSVYNSTGCDTPVRPIRTRGIIGVVTACIFALLLVLSCQCLKKHGESFLPVEKRFRLVGRRWPWYWLIITTVLGIISGCTAVDVDRVWVQGTSCIFHFIFYLCTLPTALAAVWETTRNWGTFLERKGVDEDYFRHRQDDLRAKIEFYLPLVFYLFNFLDFFLQILRNWNPIAASSVSTITDARFQVSSIFSLLSWMIIVAGLLVARIFYKPSRVPSKIIVALVALLVRIGFNIGSSFDYSFSQLHYQASPGYIYGLGFLPIIIVAIAIIQGGFREPNEDKELLRLRNLRNARLDAEIAPMKRIEPRRKSATPSRATRRSRSSVSHDYWAGQPDPTEHS